jgi:hypothetical protein
MGRSANYGAEYMSIGIAAECWEIFWNLETPAYVNINFGVLIPYRS